jgi:hypothetical protein
MPFPSRSRSVKNCSIGRGSALPESSERASSECDFMNSLSPFSSAEMESTPSFSAMNAHETRNVLDPQKQTRTEDIRWIDR